MKERLLPVGFWVAVVLTLCASLVALGYRHRVEAGNKAVALTAEYEAIESLAAAQGLTVERALTNLKAQGLGAVVLSEESLGQLVTEGRATITYSANGPARMKFTDAREIPRALRGLRIRFGDDAVPPPFDDRTIGLPAFSPLLVRSTSLGLDSGKVETVKQAGLEIVARYGNPSGVSGRMVRETLAWGKEQGAFAFLPLGDQVLGRKDALKTTSKTLQELGMLYASPEFTKIGGDANIVDDAPTNLIRLHSAQVAELDKMTMASAVERYAKAARERNMRLLLMRPASYGAEQPLSNFAAFVKATVEQIRKEGGDIGRPRPFEDPGVPKPVFLLIGLGIAATTWFVLARIVDDRKLLLIAAAILLLVGLSSWSTTKYVALLAALVFPVAAFLVLDRWRPKNPILGVVGTSMISLVGGLAIAGLMSTLRHIVMADQFAGVKLAVFVPILLVGAYFFVRLTNWRSNMRAAITWGASGLFLSILVILALLIARTGNDSGVGASGLELQFRNLLDALLYVRPRTKEFLFGHPMLVLGAFMLARYGRQKGGWAGWTALALMLGAVGQTDIVNTLCHGHIPVLLSVARVFIGLAVGCILGTVVWWIASRVLPAPIEEAPLAD